MDAKAAFGKCANLSATVLKTYISDMDDKDLMVRPGEGCNHLAWQLGHLIASEVMLLEKVAPGSGIELPEGFADAHSKATCSSDDADHFLTKAEYLELFDKVHAALLAALEDYPEPDFDDPAPEDFRSFCPTNGDVFSLIATHPMMHAGQFVIVRRKLGKPILM
ncbi:DinB family protein [Roseiconus nitratireducens]|uniref:DinB family protein n=1 Tax=Roseiconus nitratireducens TaxID=2605748 RepID=A0A5M6D5G8_9BACT|nr:DinB family protein [Roseiconus nitratireducens]KAA5542731.1 DinB family protein [Roseiconus nitratireducens]